MSAPACRSFEERLGLAAEKEGLAAASMLEVLAKADPHAAECRGCATLATDLGVNVSLFAALRRPESPALLAKLSRPPSDFAARREAAAVLDLLAPGALAAPEPSPELLARLHFLRSRARAELQAAKAAARPGGLRRLLGDWRFTVALTYAAVIVLVAVLKIDPMSVARSTASDLASNGERAISEARDAAAKRLEGTALARAAAPLAERVDYRLYKAVAKSRARAVAYSQLLFEKVFGGVQVTDGTSAHAAPRPSSRSARPGSAAAPPREPSDTSLRS